MTAAWVLGAAAGAPSRTGTGIFAGVSVVTFAAMLTGGAGADTAFSCGEGES